MTQTRNIPGLSMRAALAPASLNEEARTVDVVWTTGERVKRSSWWDGDFYEELSLDPAHVRMGRLESGTAPFLANHDSRDISSVLGVITSARLEGGKGIATVRFAKDDPAADAAWNKVRQGILPNVSVGYRINKFEKVEGGDETTPVFRATDWEPHEVSLVPLGADSAAHVRGSPETNPCVFVTRGVAPRQEKQKMEDEKKTPAPDLAARDAEVKQAERERISGIQSAVRAAKLDTKVATELVDAGTSLDEARKVVLTKLAEQADAVRTDQPSGVQITDDRADKFARGAGAWLIEKSGQRNLIAGMKARGHEKFVGVELDGGEFRGATLADLARLFLEMRGIRPNTFDKARLFETAFNYRAGYAATSDFSVLFESLLYKTMLAAYEVEQDVWSRFCGTKEVQDFRPANFYRAGTFGVLPALNENGEYTNKAIPDGVKSTVSVGTYGDIIAISRQAVINDDMSALADTAARRGMDAKSTIEAKVFELLTQNSGLGPTVGGVIFFSTTNANINATAAANTAASWDLDALKMAGQTDAAGHVLNLEPTVLLVPRAKKTEATVLNASTVKLGGTNNEPNSANGMAKDIVATSRLSGTRRYWFADPAKNPAIVVGFLAGQGQAPVLSSNPGWRVDGTEWKVRMDFGVSFFDPKCAVTNAGA